MSDIVGDRRKESYPRKVSNLPYSRAYCVRIEKSLEIDRWKRSEQVVKNSGNKGMETCFQLRKVVRYVSRKNISP